MALRNPLNGNGKHFDNKSVKRGGATPYGWAYLDGKLVIDPKEQIIVRQIIKLHQSGKSNQQIAGELNSKKVSTRNRGVWRRCTIRSIIIRYKEQSKNGESNE
jgi:hypothetical protein